ncbi:DEAD-box ATP-dependent RNA helicase 32 [Vitis vinifera]|uniref:DEAD-box ATP-dependent RNA helicase 32 n=1 Tax=Vitis vinifera TaxID=29760 RepID=A0A438IS40_VITVI|nr:DEAD-box ATP-dependent RNA helicase 32 [Vitis vinifera]
MTSISEALQKRSDVTKTIRGSCGRYGVVSPLTQPHAVSPFWGGETQVPKCEDPIPDPKKRQFVKQKRLTELQEIELLESWIEFGKPDSGSNPLSLAPPPSNAPIGRIDGDSFSPYAGCDRFDRLPLSQKTIDGLKKSE